MRVDGTGTDDGPRGDTAWRPTVGSDEQVLRLQMPREEDLRMAAQRRALLREAFQAAPFPLYGLPPEWPGRRFIGGTNQSWPDPADRWTRPGTLHAASLVHGGNVEGEGPMLVVETAEPGSSRSGGRLRMAAEGLWGEVPDATPLDDRLRRHLVTITVDGEPADFDILSLPADHQWVGRARRGGRVLTVEGHSFPLPATARDGGLHIVRVEDLGPYES